MTPEYPSSGYEGLAKRIPFAPASSREWTGNAANDDHHHGLVSINETPFYIRLLWQSRDGDETVEVGSYKLSLQRLASGGFVRAEGRHVRLRFVRDADGTVAIQVNDDGPALPVGLARFARDRDSAVS